MNEPKEICSIEGHIKPPSYLVCCERCGKDLRDESSFPPNTESERIEFLHKAIRSVTESHGAPCGCILCEALIFDSLAKDGEINLKTGERK